MTEGVKTGLWIVFQFGGWATAAIFGYFWHGQRLRIKGLEKTIEVLERHDKRREEKDKIRDKLLKEMSAILSDEKMHRDNKKKIDELFQDLDKPWKIDGDI